MSLHIILILLCNFLAIFLVTGHVLTQNTNQDIKQKMYLKNKSENIILRLIRLYNSKISR